MNEQDSQSELTPDQYLRFKVLVPFHSSMEKKRREDIKLGYMQDASKIYSEAIELIEAYVTTRVKEAISVGIYNVHDLLFAYGKECEDNGVVSERAVSIRMDLSAYYHEKVTTTTNGKGE